MRIAILSDIHANHPALDAVLKHSKSLRVDRTWFLGDLIGYGPNPVEAMQWLKGDYSDEKGINFPAPDAWVMGNHDAMMADLSLQGKTGLTDEFFLNPHNRLNYPLPDNASLPDDRPDGQGDGLMDFSIFERDPAGTATDVVTYVGKSHGKFSSHLNWRDLGGVIPLRAIELNRLALFKNENINEFWRREFTVDRIHSKKEHLDGVDYVLVHGGLANPLTDYIYPWYEILIPEEFRRLKLQAEVDGYPRIQLYGQTHVPTFVKVCSGKANGDFNFEIEKIFSGVSYSLLSGSDSTCLAIINPGSVGQPRDNDPRAAYAILDTGKKTVTFQRVHYSNKEVARKLTSEHYPRSLAQRILSAEPVSDTPDIWREHYLRAREAG
jgi:predicted phosphodiesterase